jgi:hypothetical protein
LMTTPVQATTESHPTATASSLYYTHYSPPAIRGVADWRSDSDTPECPLRVYLFPLVMSHPPMLQTGWLTHTEQQPKPYIAMSVMLD